MHMLQRIFPLLLFVSTVTQAGVLSDFERDISTPAGYEISIPGDSSSDSCGLLWESCESAVAETATVTPGELYPQVDTDLGLELRYHSAGKSVAAYEVQIKKNFRQFGIYARMSHYIENQPADELDLASLYFLYRPAVQKGLSAEFGIGVTTLSGNQVSSGSSVYLPIRFELKEGVAMEISVAMTALTNPLIEVAGRLVIKQGNLIYSIGHKSLRSPNMNLQGPVLGLTYIW